MILNLISLLFGPNDVFMNILEIIFYILVIIGQWKMFEKAGESGWKALIPIYNLYILYKIVWDTKVFWVELGLILFSYLVPLIGIIGLIGLFLISIVLPFKVASAFGRGMGFGFGLLFLEPVFTIILGFGTSEYYGADG